MKYQLSGRAIVTKFLGPTNHRGSRVKATLSGEKSVSVTMPWCSGLNSDRNHAHAAEKLAEQLGWDQKPSAHLVGGWMQHGAVFLLRYDNT